MKEQVRYPFLLLLSLLVFSCDTTDDPASNNNGNNLTDEEFRENFGSQTTRDFLGQIVDADNQLIQGATVKIGNTTVQTDQNGVVIANGASVYEKFAYGRASKTGYMDGSRSLVPTSGRNMVKIMLLESGALETIQSGQESEVSIYSGTKIKI